MWLAYDTINNVDRELRDVRPPVAEQRREVLKARRVKGAGSPEILSRSVKTRGWRPVDTRLQVSDVPRIVENLGGSKLYGDDPTVALRELIQNAADAVQARRKLQGRPTDWGQIIVDLLEKDENFWLVVEDNGIGMSEQVLTGPLLDFGSSFWRSPMAIEEFPGLMASGCTQSADSASGSSQCSCWEQSSAYTRVAVTKGRKLDAYWNFVAEPALVRSCLRQTPKTSQLMAAHGSRFC